LGLEQKLELVSARILEFNGFISRISPVMAQHRKDSFERVFELVSAWFNLTGLIYESLPL